MELVERIAQVISGYRLSANADGTKASAAEDVDAAWVQHRGEAVAILKALRDPSPMMIETGMEKEWAVLFDREVSLVDKGHTEASLIQNVTAQRPAGSIS